MLEGPTLLAEALAADAELTDVFVADDVELDDRLTDLLDRAAATGVPVWAVEGARLRHALDTVTPQPVAAVAERRPAPASVLAEADLVVVLVGLSDPGNAGTILRTARATGAGAVVCTSDTVDLWGPKCARSSAGAVLHVPIVVGGTAAEVLELVGSAGLRRLGTRAADADDYDDVDLSGRVAVVLGNEAHGLAPELSAALDGWVRIPMEGGVESLNVAMAGAVLCFEVVRRRRAAARHASASPAPADWTPVPGVREG